MPLTLPIPLLGFNCHHFATNHPCAVKTLIFYCCHFQLSSLCNWPSSWVHPVYKIPSLGVKNTSSLLWSSANFCSISQNMHYKHPVAAQHWKTNKEFWTWKDDWPPWRTSTYKRPCTQKGNYLVWYFVIINHVSFPFHICHNIWINAKPNLQFLVHFLEILTWQSTWNRTMN